MLRACRELPSRPSSAHPVTGLQGDGNHRVGRDAHNDGPYTGVGGYRAAGGACRHSRTVRPQPPQDLRLLRSLRRLALEAVGDNHLGQRQDLDRCRSTPRDLESGDHGGGAINQFGCRFAHKCDLGRPSNPTTGPGLAPATRGARGWASRARGRVCAPRGRSMLPAPDAGFRDRENCRCAPRPT